MLDLIKHLHPLKKKSIAGINLLYQASHWHLEKNVSISVLIQHLFAQFEGHIVHTCIKHTFSFT